MDRNQFDTMTRGLTSETSRRRIVAGVLGGAVALLAGASLAAPGGKKGGGALKSKPTKTPICHFDEETGLYTFVQVPLKPGKGHAKHANDVLTGVTSVADCEFFNDSLQEPVPEPVLEPGIG